MYQVSGWIGAAVFRRKLYAQIKGYVCRSCGGRAPWNVGEDVCSDCEIKFAGTLLDLHESRAEARIRTRVLAVRDRIEAETFGSMGRT